MKTIKYLLLFACVAVTAFSQTVRPYLLPAATAPGATDKVTIDSLVGHTRALPASYWLPAQPWAALGATTGSTTAAWGTKNTVTLTGNLTLTSFTGTEAANSWCFIEGIFNGTYTFTFPASYRNGQTNATTTTLTPPAGRHTFKFESLDGTGTFLLTDTVPSALDLAGTGNVVNRLPITNIATGTPDGTKFVRDDGVLAVPAGGGGSVAIGTIALWATSDLSTAIAAGWLSCDGTNGTPNLAAVSGGASYIVMGGGAVAAPTFSPAAGTYSSTQTVTVSSATSGATIKYTTDGTTTPTRSVGSTYSTPLSIAATTTLKAMAFKNLFTDSGVTSGTFTIGGGYLLTDDMEYTSNGAGTAAGWVLTAGTPNFGYNTSPAPLLGSYSLKLNSTNEVNHSFTSSSSVECFAAINIASLSVDQYPLAFKDGSLTNLLYLKVYTDGSVTFSHGGAFTGSMAAGTVTAGTTFYVWMNYAPGTGSNGTANLYVSSSQTKPGSPSLSTSTGAGTGNAADFSIYSASGNVIVDKVRVSSSSIGSNPL